jgi:hypothetical protein
MTSHLLTKQENKLFRRSRGYFFILRKLLIQRCSPRSAHSRPDKLHLQKKIDAKMPSLFRLCSIKGRHNCHLPSNMRLTIHCKALYLSEPKVRRRACGHMFMAGTEDIPINNGAVLNISQIIRAVMSLAAEAELVALFINAKMVVLMQHILKEVGHPQTRIPI